MHIAFNNLHVLSALNDNYKVGMIVSLQNHNAVFPPALQCVGWKLSPRQVVHHLVTHQHHHRLYLMSTSPRVPLALHLRPGNSASKPTLASQLPLAPPSQLRSVHRSAADTAPGNHPVPSLQQLGDDVRRRFGVGGQLLGVRVVDRVARLVVAIVLFDAGAGVQATDRLVQVVHEGRVVGASGENGGGDFDALCGEPVHEQLLDGVRARSACEAVRIRHRRRRPSIPD